MMPFGVAINVEEEGEMPLMPQNGWGYECVQNHYSNKEDKGYVEVVGVIVTTPRSQGRTNRSKKVITQHHNLRFNVGEITIAK
jgi:hypothetical protein